MSKQGIYTTVIVRRLIPINLVFFVLTLTVYGCFGSRERGDEVDSGVNEADVTVQTGEASSNDSGDDAGVNDAPCAPKCPEMQWITIRGSTFIMGSPEGINTSFEQPQHEVTVQTFKISETEITVEQYGACVDARICSEPRSSHEEHNWGKSSRKNHPINGVSWFQAEVFAQWLGGRLPSEAEWESAARSGGEEIIYPWGNEDANCERAVIGRDEDGNECVNEMSEEVCSKPLGNTDQGLCDMAGNVSEWVEDDLHFSYSGAPSDGQAWVDSPRSNQRVLRGCDWSDSPNKCRSAARGSSASPSVTNPNIGFRVVLETK